MSIPARVFPGFRVGARYDRSAKPGRPMGAFFGLSFSFAGKEKEGVFSRTFIGWTLYRPEEFPGFRIGCGMTRCWRVPACHPALDAGSRRVSLVVFLLGYSLDPASGCRRLAGAPRPGAGIKKEPEGCLLLTSFRLSLL